MDVLIKGLTLPKKGITNLTIYNNDGHVRYTQDDGQFIEMGDATAIELPPHEELIDKASVLSLLRYYCDMREYKKEVRCKDCENWNACVVRPIMDEVNKLDTVLEAST